MNYALKSNIVKYRIVDAVTSTSILALLLLFKIIRAVKLLICKNQQRGKYEK